MSAPGGPDAVIRSNDTASLKAVPLFKTGADAAEHGLRDIENPPADAVKIIRKLDPR